MPDADDGIGIGIDDGIGIGIGIDPAADSNAAARSPRFRFSSRRRIGQLFAHGFADRC